MTKLFIYITNILLFIFMATLTILSVIWFRSQETISEDTAAKMRVAVRSSALSVVDSLSQEFHMLYLSIAMESHDSRDALDISAVIANVEDVFAGYDDIARFPGLFEGYVIFRRPNPQGTGVDILDTRHRNGQESTDTWKSVIKSFLADDPYGIDRRKLYSLIFVENDPILSFEIHAPGEMDVPVHVAVLLNMDVIINEAVPELATQFFTDNSGEMPYQITIVHVNEFINKSIENVDVVMPLIRENSFTSQMDFQRRRLKSFAESGLGKDGTAGDDEDDELYEHIVQTRSSAFESLANPWFLIGAHKAGGIREYITQRRSEARTRMVLLLLILLGSLLLLIVLNKRILVFVKKESDFIAMISHELKTPIGSIKLSADNIASGIVQGAGDIHEYAGIILNETRRLGTMVENILTLSSLHNGRATHLDSSVDPLEVMRKAKERCSFLSHESQVEILMQPSGKLPQVRGDKNALISALENLLTNALKHGLPADVSTGCERTVHLTAKERTWKRIRGVEIAVIDHGPGIPRNEQHRVFRMYERGNNAVLRQIPGTGLGLSTVKRIVKAHRGRITLYSIPGEVTEVRIWLRGE